MNLLRPQKIDATQGKLFKNIILYTIPVIIGTLVQNCFNAIDLMVLGNMADANAVASVGATGSIIGLVVNSFIGIGAGSKIILSHQFGAKNSVQIKKTVDTALLTAVGIGVAVAVLGVPLAPMILNYTNCPADCFAGAVLYIRIYVAAAPAILLYNFGSAAISASGDSQSSLYYIIIAGLVNIILNVILCLVLPQKVIAVAVATAASQIVGAFLVLRKLCNMEGDGRVILREMRFNLESFKQIMGQGLPLALNNALYPLANLQIQSAVNTYGVAAIAGGSATSSVIAMTDAFITSFSSTATVFMGQNLGADNQKRVKQSFRYCLAISMTLSLIIVTSVYSAGEMILSIYLPGDAEAIRFGMLKMKYLLLFSPIGAFSSIFSAAIQVRGYAAYTSAVSIITVIAFRVFWMSIIYPMFATYDMLMLCFVVSWILQCIACLIGYYFLCYRRVKKKG